MTYGDPFAATAAAFTQLCERNASGARAKDDAAAADALLLIRHALDGACAGSTLLQARRIDVDAWSRDTLALALQYPVRPPNEP
jgi:hypothetical protein